MTVTERGDGGPVPADAARAGAAAEPAPSAVSAALVAERLAAIQDRIVAAGGDPGAVSVVAVTKSFGIDSVLAALESGLVELGENYAQELLAKAEALDGTALEGTALEGTVLEGTGRPRWQFIGQLQRNKVRQLAGHVHRFQSVDRAGLLDELGRRAPGARVLIQVNTTAEPQKAGCAPEELGALVERGRGAGLVVEGLMTVGPTGPGVPARPAFASLRRLVDRHGLDICSMGMTDDLDVAVGEGSTMVRIGRALFGPRPRRGATAL